MVLVSSGFVCRWHRYRYAGDLTMSRNLVIVVGCSFVLILIFIGWQQTGLNVQIQQQYPEIELYPVWEPALSNITESNISTIFRKIEFTRDYVPTSSDPVRLNETIHICLTIGGASAAREARFLLRSLFIHARRSDLYFHLIVTDDAKEVLKGILKDFQKPAVNIYYEFVKFDPDFIKQEAKAVNVRITHHSGVFGMSKSFMYKILENVERCLILDTDLVFGTDPAFIWAYFKELRPPYLGMVKIGKSDNDMCSGVMLQRFSDMRKLNFELLYKYAIPKFCQPAKSEKGERFGCRYGDQSMFYAVHISSPVFKDLSNSWSLELCHTFRGHTFKSWRQNTKLFFGIAHFNCLQLKRKLNTIDEYMAKFRHTKLGHYLYFLGRMDARSIDLGRGQATHLH